jgi:hypothetical protein
MKNLWMLGLCLASSVTMTAPKSDLASALYNVKTAVVNKLNIDSANCQRGIRDGCQDAVLDTVELNTVNSEIALHKLRSSVRGEELKELIDDAIDKLGDVDYAVSEIQDKLDE